MIMNDKGELLCVKSKGKPYFSLPGGTSEGFEDYTATAKREGLEELGVEPKLGNVIFVQQIMEQDGNLRSSVAFAVHNYEDFYNIDITKTSHGAAELDACEFIDIHTEDFMPVKLREFLPKTHTELFTMPCQALSAIQQPNTK